MCGHENNVDDCEYPPADISFEEYLGSLIGHCPPPVGDPQRGQQCRNGYASDRKEDRIRVAIYRLAYLSGTAQERGND